MIREAIFNTLLFTTFMQVNFNINAADVEENQVIVGECSICMEDITADKVFKCPNAHKFHSECMKTWLDGKTEFYRRCPMCRALILLPDREILVFAGVMFGILGIIKLAEYYWL